MTFTCVWDNTARTITATPGGAATSCSNGNFDFQNYVNHDYTQQEGIQLQVFKTGNTTANYTGIAYIDYTAATVSTVTLTPQSLVVGENAPVLVAFEVGAFDLTADFKIIMTFPRRFFFATPTTNQGYFDGTITCSNNTALIQASPACSYTTVTSTGVSTVSITNLYVSTIGSTTSASFFITNIKNPISTATVTGFTFKIVDPADDTYEIATKDSGITMAVTTARTATIAVTPPTTYVVYAVDTVLFTITPGVEIEDSCSMTLDISTDTPCQSTAYGFGILGTSGSCTTTQWTGGTCSGTHLTTQSLSLGLNLQAAPQVKETGTFTYTLRTSGSDDIATGTVTIPASSFSAGTISAFTFTHVTGNSTVIQESTQWEMGFTLGHALTNPWVILVTYPTSEFTITDCTGPTALNGFSAGTA